MATQHVVAALALVHLAAGCSQPTDDASVTLNSANATASAPATPAAETGDTKLVVAFGDSLYAGYNLAPGEGFAPVLERALKDRGIAAQVVNAGVSGDTSAGGRGRLAFVLDGLSRKPDLVIVGLGANDMLRGLEPTRTRENLDAFARAVLETARGHGENDFKIPLARRAIVRALEQAIAGQPQSQSDKRVG